MDRISIKAENGKSASVHVGEAFELVLEENPTTGYGWELVTGADFQVISSDFVMRDTSVTGSGVLRRFTLKAENHGTFKLEARLRRNWEDKKLFIDRCEMDVVVT